MQIQLYHARRGSRDVPYIVLPCPDSLSPMCLCESCCLLREMCVWVKSWGHPSNCNCNRSPTATANCGSRAGRRPVASRAASSPRQIHALVLLILINVQLGRDRRPRAAPTRSPPGRTHPPFPSARAPASAERARACNVQRPFRKGAGSTSSHREFEQGNTAILMSWATGWYHCAMRTPRWLVELRQPRALGLLLDRISCIPRPPVV